MKLREQGMTLLEVVVAVLVLGVGLFTSASLQMRALHAAEGARRDAQVVQLGQSLIEQTRSAGRFQPGALHDWRARLEALLGSSGRGQAVVAGQWLRLETCWQDARGAQPQTIQLQGWVLP
ncbi:prepilin-type N-terminal cleavage/methylation domain-containing protein [Pseudomonas sp. REB1044]|uniref:prepilin-type N-terminal cleavage/methylation domain-containing protein n=1 Tax=Pseudomonas sp. REB1044 TaxID=2675224 RepID=UPI00315CBAB2